MLKKNEANKQSERNISEFDTMILCSSEGRGRCEEVCGGRGVRELWGRRFSLLFRF